jgi:hypothetical protein
MASDMQLPQELEGITTWDKLFTREARFRRFLLRADGIAFEFEYDRSWYSGSFPRQPDGSFAGRFNARGQGGSRSGRATCQITETEDGYSLDGIWFEREEYGSERTYPDWHADLYPVEV